MGHPPKAFLGLLWTTLGYLHFGNAQNTDGDLRINFFRFVLTLSPSSAISCNAQIAETVRNVAEDCLQAFAPTGCSSLFPVVLPEQILLGGAQCRSDDAILIYGGAMDFPVDGSEQGQVNQCVLEILEGDACLSTFQNVFANVQDLVYSVDTPEPTQAPVVPTFAPTIGPTVPPTVAPSLPPTAKPTEPPTLSPTPSPTDTPLNPPPTNQPSLRPSSSPTSKPSAQPSSPTGSPPKGGNLVEDETGPKQASSGRSGLGIYVGAAAGGLCLLLLLVLFAAKRRRKVQEEVQEVKDADVAEQPKGGLHSLDSLHPQPVQPPPGILHHNSPRSAPRTQPRLFHSLQDDDYSAPGTSIGDPDLTLISSVDMGSMDGSESFVDQNRSFSLTISKDMLGGSSEVPKNRNAVLSRLGASLTPNLVLSSSSDDGDSPPSPPTRKKGGFYELQDDGDGTDEELLLEIPDSPEPIQPEDFAPDTDWDPDDTEDAEQVDSKDMFRDRKSPVNDPEAGLQFPIPPELKDSTRRKPRSSTPRNVLGGSGKISPSISSGSSGGS